MPRPLFGRGTAEGSTWHLFPRLFPGASHAPSVLFDFTAAALTQHIFSCIRYSYFITPEIKPRITIIDLYTGYHAVSRKTNVSAPLSACVTKTVGCIHFYLCAIRLYQLQCIKEGSYSSKKYSTSVCSRKLREKKKKKGYTSISPFLLFAPGFNFQDLYSHSNSTATAFWGKKTTCEGKDSGLC